MEGKMGARMVSVCVCRVGMCVRGGSVCGGTVQGKGAQHYSLLKGMWDEHMGLRGSGCSICQQEFSGWSRREGTVFCEASPGLQGAQRVQCPGMAEQKGSCARSLCLAGSWPPQKELAQFAGQVANKSLGRAGGAPGLWNCSGPSGNIEPAGSQAGNATVGDTPTVEEPQAWREAVKLGITGAIC